MLSTVCGKVFTTSKPPLEILYELDYAVGSVTILAKGGAAKREELLTIFANCVLGETTLPEAPKKTYDLNVFKDPNKEFRTDAGHHIQCVRVIAIRLKFHDRPQDSAVFYADQNNRHDSVYDLLREKLAGGIDELKLSTILRVDLQVIFSEPGENEFPVEFHISTPSSCNLGDGPRDRMLREYLRLWGIEHNAKRLERVRATARNKRSHFHL